MKHSSIRTAVSCAVTLGLNTVAISSAWAGSRTVQTVVSAIGAVAGPKAAGVVFLIGEEAHIIESAGGDWARLMQELTGGNDWSSCADMCIAAPSGARLTNIEWSDRTGSLFHIAENVWEGGAPNVSNEDWSGWRNLLAFKNESDQWVVCATGTNWSHNQSATKRIRITYTD